MEVEKILEGSTYRQNDICTPIYENVIYCNSDLNMQRVIVSMCIYKEYYIIELHNYSKTTLTHTVYILSGTKEDAIKFANNILII